VAQGATCRYYISCICIETHVLLAGGVDPRDRREALAWAKVHMAQLMQKWQEFNA
jgi:hypothetical protein